MKITNIRVNRQSEPIGIDTPTPLFGWNINTEASDWVQAAYRIRVYQKDSLLWDSQEQQDARMAEIPYAGKPLQSCRQYHVVISSWGNSAGTDTAESTFETAYLQPAQWHGDWIGETDDTHSVFSKTFTTDQAMSRARLYLCGLGHYEAYLDGVRIGDRVLEPGWTNYDKTCLYSTYDLTRRLHPGTHTLLIYLGNGMYNVPGGRYVYYTRSYGLPKLSARLLLETPNGATQEIVTDSSWQQARGPYDFCCIYGGEDFDARRDPLAGAQLDWQAASVVDAPKGQLQSGQIPPLTEKEQYLPRSVSRLSETEWLYDFGKNFSGWATVWLRNTHPGQTVTFTPSELLHADGTPNQWITRDGHCWRFTACGQPFERYTPRFTYYGFRYLKVSGAAPASYAGEAADCPVIESIVGKFIYPDFERTGSFTCENSLFTGIHSIILQAIKSNTKSYSTDCPHREKLGWLEQTHLIGPGMLFNFGMLNHFEKIARDMVDAQRENGLIPDIAPEYVVFGYHEGFVDSPEWGSALILNAWYCYRRFGSLQSIQDNYPAMKRYIAYLLEKGDCNLLHHGLGDWLDIGPCPAYSQNTPPVVTASCILHLDLMLMQRFAELMGNAQDAVYYGEQAGKTASVYNTLFYDKDSGRYANGSQAAQAMSLMCGMVQGDPQKVLEVLLRDLKARDYATTAGDIGYPFVLRALTAYGQDETIARMLCNTDQPGYGYQVRCGATTLTEDWSGPDPENPHGSQNHLMLGGIEEWFFGGLLGFQVQESGSFTHIVLRPYFARETRWAKGRIPHPYGDIALEWRREETEKISVLFTLPAGMTCTFENDGKSIPFGSGTHRIEVPDPMAADGTE